MSDDYLWDRSGTPDPDTEQLEELLAPLAHDAPLDELRLAKGRRGEPVRATAREPVEAPPPSGRVKGKMNFFDKRIIGAATFTAAAIGLLGVTAYKRHVDSPPPSQSPTVAIAAALAMTPHASPVARTTEADLAITAGEDAWIHVPFGAVDVEIQSKCDADVEMSVVTGPQPPRQALTAVVRQRAGAPTGGDSIIASIDNTPDGTASAYHLVAGVGSDGMFQYTARCAGQPLMHGVLVIDRNDAHEPIGPITNARVFDDADDVLGTLHSIHVFGSVLPGATVSIDGAQVELQPPDPDNGDPIIAPTFSTNVPISAGHPVAAVRIDDAKGTHFYVSRRAMIVVASCGTMTAPKQTAAKLEGQGDHAGALAALETAMVGCKPDRETLALALTYACEAGDAEAAHIYWRKLPAELQRTLEPKCAQHAITRDQLDAH